MSQQVIVDRDLMFRGVANITPNVKGDMLPERMTHVDWFDGYALDVTSDYVQTLGGTNDLGALTAGGEHGFKGTCGDTDNQVAFLATGLIFDISQSPAIEAKIKIVDVSGTVVYFGFSDATSETTPAATIDADGGTLTAAATDAVGFVIDADLGSSSVYAASANTGAAVQSADTGVDWADNQSKTLRVVLDTSGNARLYIDGVEKAYIALAVADVPLCAILNYGQRAGVANTVVHMRYLARWQDVP